MTSPFEAMLGTFFNGALSSRVTYTPVSGNPPVQGTPVTVRALVGMVDPVVDPTRGVIIQSKILSFDFQRSEVPTAPSRGAMILYNGENFRVAEPAAPDADGYVWRAQAHRVG